MESRLFRFDPTSNPDTDNFIGSSLNTIVLTSIIKSSISTGRLVVCSRWGPKTSVSKDDRNQRTRLPYALSGWVRTPGPDNEETRGTETRVGSTAPLGRHTNAVRRMVRVWRKDCVSCKNNFFYDSICKWSSKVYLYIRCYLIKGKFKYFICIQPISLLRPGWPFVSLGKWNVKRSIRFVLSCKWFVYFRFDISRNKEGTFDVYIRNIYVTCTYTDLSENFLMGWDFGSLSYLNGSYLYCSIVILSLLDYQN